MNSFVKFIKDLVDIFQSEKILEDFSIMRQREAISLINQYFFTSYKEIEKTKYDNKEYKYFSDFHKYWEDNAKRIINPRINEKKCEEIADILHRLYIDYKGKPFRKIYDKSSLSDEEVCLVRLFTANQDFSGSRNFPDFAKIYLDNKSLFDLEYIRSKPGEFLSKLKIEKLSQNDKRTKYSKALAEFLIEKKLKPINLFDYCKRDYRKLQTLLIDGQLKGSGFGKKKADMLIRDMRVFKIWKNGEGIDKIDVASDFNTVKVALRTGILEIDILLLSSFLDIFSYQYGLIYTFTSKAWRRVWEIWNKKYPDEAIESPCLMDYLLYRLIGKEFCKEKYHIYSCLICEHEFLWHTGKKRICINCGKGKIENKTLEVLINDLPCKFEDGYECMKKIRKVDILPGLYECPFRKVCEPNSSEFKKYSPPKSISILGKTGWYSARARKDEGGGGLMA